MKEMLTRRILPWLPLLPLFLLLLLCAGFLSNPLVFDDQNFFSPGRPEAFIANGFSPTPRWWVFQTFALTFTYLGDELYWFRIGNLAFHIGVAAALYFLIRQLLLDLDDHPSSAVSPHIAALIAATLFAFHPLANFAQGYLIQRSILCATLFALVCCYLFWQGLKGSRAALWGSCAAFAVSIYAKEHVIMVPAVCLGLLILHARSGMTKKFKLPEIFSALALQGVIALVVLLQSKGILGTPYELLNNATGSWPMTQTEHLLPLSILNQAGLFFKYLFLWILPIPGFIALDMQEPFPSSFASWTLWGGMLMYLAFGGVAAYLLFRGKQKGLVGLSMLSAWLLFFTEFAVIRVYESFALYRSYLWAPLLFTLVALGIRRLRKRVTTSLGLAFFLLFSGLSYDRLTVLSNPFFAWDEAAQLLEKKESIKNVHTAPRIYYNRARAYHLMGMLEKAMPEYERINSRWPDYPYAYYARGQIYAQWKDWEKALAFLEKAISLRPGYVNNWLQLAYVHEKMSNPAQAKKCYKIACHLGDKEACKLVEAF